VGSGEVESFVREFQGLVRQVEALRARQGRLRELAEAEGLAMPTIVAKGDGNIVLQPPEAPPLAGENVMNLVMVSAECAPWSKTGGLGDVAGALPKALAERGHRVMCVVPRYGDYGDVADLGVRLQVSACNSMHEVGYFHKYESGVDWVFVDHGAFFGRQGGEIYAGSREELSFRLALFCKAALEAPWHVPCGGSVYGDDNLVFIANDWHTSLLPVYLQAHYRDHGKYTYARSILVLHNLAHQGRAPLDCFYDYELPENYKELFYLDDPWGGECSNIMKAGLVSAHRVVAVSKGYAWEVQTDQGGWGLAPVLREHSWKLSGIVNGIDLDEWDPSTDSALQTDGYLTYSEDNVVEGKRACKLALQRELGLPENPDVPIFGFIGRLDEQKGVDLIVESCGYLASRGAQVVLLGSGREDLEQDLRRVEAENNGHVRSWVGFSVDMAHRITAAADLLLMPSRFEPCGLNQLYAMRYGTVPIVHAVGGLRDTVHQYNPVDHSGTGWQFTPYDGDHFRQALDHGLTTFYDYRDNFVTIQRNGMKQDLSWSHAAEQYENVLVEAKFQW